MPMRYRVAAMPKKDGAKPHWTDPKELKDATNAVVTRQRKHVGKGFTMREVAKNEKWGPERTL
jgi:hypothetical protein